MKLLIILFLLSGPAIYGQRAAEINFIKKEVSLAKNNLYFFCRGTKSKSRLIAEKFNKTDTNITHVGTGFIKNKRLQIYNVTDENLRLESALKIDSLESFISSPDVYYLSIWKCDLNVKEFQKFIKACKRYSSRKIFFDASFNISNDDTLYCSEFCASLLNNIGLGKFDFMPEIIEINNRLIESVLDRKWLCYFPVDFFQANKYFTKVFEYKFIE